MCQCHNLDINMKKPAKSPADSEVTMTELILPVHTNALGGAFGGVIMSWIDIAAAISAGRHARCVVVTASVDALVFEAPVKLGDVVTLKAMVNRAFNTSMEVGVLVESEDQRSGKRVRNVKAYLTFVGLDDNGKPQPVPPIAPKTEEDQRRFRAAGIRKETRIKLAQTLV